MIWSLILVIRLASAWQPFYYSPPSFSAHSTASILSLQGKTPLPGHPKTLRDLTHATEFLTLPASFEAIQLGETFSSCLGVNNETNIDIEGVTLRVEVQTANSKLLVAELGGPQVSSRRFTGVCSRARGEGVGPTCYGLQCLIPPPSIVSTCPWSWWSFQMKPVSTSSTSLLYVSLPAELKYFDLRSLGHESSFCQDKGAHTSISISTDESFGAREGVSRNLHSEYGTRRNVVRANGV